jgi:hypothetical protein
MTKLRAASSKSKARSIPVSQSSCRKQSTNSVGNGVGKEQHESANKDSPRRRQGCLISEKVAGFADTFA